MTAGVTRRSRDRRYQGPDLFAKIPRGKPDCEAQDIGRSVDGLARTRPARAGGDSRVAKHRCEDLAEKTKFSERHVRYRLQAARILGFLQGEGEPELTPRAKRLLATETGSLEEKKQLVSAISDCASVQLIAPNLLTLPEVDVKKLGDRIARLSGLSPATAERRAMVLRSWHRDFR